MSDKNRSLISIHLAVVLFGFAGLFGKWLVLPAMVIVFGRVVVSSSFMFIVIKGQKGSIRLRDRRDYGWLIISGILLAVHWVFFYEAIQISTVAVGTLTYAVYPVFVTFMEPLFFKEKLRLREVLTAVVMFMGVLFIVPEFELSNQMTVGIIIGLISSFAYATLSIFNRKVVKNYTGAVVTFYEQLTAAVVLIPVLVLAGNAGLLLQLTLRELLLIVLLGIVFTGVAHSVFVQGMKFVKAQTAGMICSLESVYSIILAAILVSEIPSWQEVVGGVIIMGAVLYSTWATSTEGKPVLAEQ